MADPTAPAGDRRPASGTFAELAGSLHRIAATSPDLASTPLWAQVITLDAHGKLVIKAPQPPIVITNRSPALTRRTKATTAFIALHSAFSLFGRQSS